ncbi:MAG: hypothetical protein ACMG6E_10415 [Candidatus Roizmanbacteria bacterium]
MQVIFKEIYSIPTIIVYSERALLDCSWLKRGDLQGRLMVFGEGQELRWVFVIKVVALPPLG